MKSTGRLLRVLGSLRFEGFDTQQHGAIVAGEKRVALLVSLALAGRGEFVRRDTLLALLWPDADEPHARGSLRALVHQLRTALGSDVILSRGDQELAIDTTRLGCDVLQFEQACRADDWKTASTLYQGTLLEGFAVTGAADFSEWLEHQRARLRQLARDLAWCEAQRARSRTNTAQEIATLQRLLLWAPYDEPGVRALMSALDRGGDRAGALEVFARFSERLRAELETDPAPETSRLATALRARTEAVANVGSDHLDGPTAASQTRAPPAGARRLLLPLVVATVVVGALAVQGGSTSPRYARTAIAVLPFRNLSVDSSNAYLAEALNAEIVTQLSRVSDLAVRSRTSVREYASVQKPIRDIARELGVGTLLEGDAQISKGHVRLNVRLVDARTGQTIWAQRYDGTPDDAFVMQSDIAQRVVTTVGASLTGSERAAIREPPSANAEAYLLYLQGVAYVSRPGYLRQNWRIAQNLYEAALERDSTFAVAHAALSELHGLMYWERYDPTAGRLTQQREHALKALQLAPESPQSHVAMGLTYYWGQRNYHAALDELTIALRGLPNDGRVWELIGFVQRRLGKWDDALASYERAIRLDPRNANLYWNLGALTYQTMHRYGEAIEASRHALSLAPDLPNVAIRTGWAYVAWLGQLDTLRSALARIPNETPLGELGTGAAQRVLLLLWERQPDSLLALVETVHAPVFDGQEFFIPTTLYAGWAHQMRSDSGAAYFAFETARAFLDSVMRTAPDDYRVHMARGLALAGLRRKPEALREAEWLRASVVYRDDGNAGRYLAENRARILAQVGDFDGALDELERLLVVPSSLSANMLRLDPLLDPLRGLQRFKRLVARG